VNDQNLEHKEPNTVASKIDEKYAALKDAGFDLGQPTSSEQSAGYGGTLRSYQNGNIYWHPVMGASAHVVIGGILSLYLSRGGPGVNPHTAIREYGFPLSDELLSPIDGLTPYSPFEFGQIYWTQGTGGVVIFGDLNTGYRQHGELGLPLSNVFTIWIGSGIYCERGILWTCPSLKGLCLAGSIAPPLMGQPAIVQAGAANLYLGPLITWEAPTGYDLRRLLDPNLHPELPYAPTEALSMVWKNCLTLSPVGGGADVWLDPGEPNIAQTGDSATVSLTTMGQLQDRKLYDLKLHPPVNQVYNLSPHRAYAKASWDNFGLFHITDIHLSLRNQQLRDALNRAGMTDAAQHYANCQECFRDFIKYANHLHAIGLADAVMATGDLIDYVVEPGDNKYQGNFARLRRMILGQPFEPGMPAYDELQIPTFMTFGNHDYRLNPYSLSCYIDIDLGFWERTKPLDNFSTFNITPNEAVAAQGGPVRYGLSDFNNAMAMLTYDSTGAAYAYFAKYFSPHRTFIVKFGNNRLVMLDNSWDAGVPKISGWGDLIKYLYEINEGHLSRAADCAVNGVIDADGLSYGVFITPVPALSDAGQNGVVIVGMHVPPFSPVKSEFPYYLRETVHPTVDPSFTQEYLSRNGINTDGWTSTGTPFFHVGEIGNGKGLDEGVISEYGMDFVRLLAGIGEGVTRPVDLFLCGHHHQRMEYRLRWNGNDVEYYMDFYTESPATYYSTTAPVDFIDGQNTLKKGEQIAIKIVPGAPATGTFTTTIATESTDEGPLAEVRGTMSLPPYADTLDVTNDAKTWWQNHRPIIAQTSALGPGDPRQRWDPRWEITYTTEQNPNVPSNTTSSSSTIVESKTKPTPPVLQGETVAVSRLMTATADANFNGFRFVQVQGNVIQKVRYINMADLRAADFVMPWEPRPHPHPVPPGPAHPSPAHP
jgi:hypothetical protein